MPVVGFTPGQPIWTQVNQPSCTYPQLFPSTGRHRGKVAVRNPEEETQGDDQGFFLQGNMLLPKLGASQRCRCGGECSLEHTVQTAVAVLDLVGQKRR